MNWKHICIPGSIFYGKSSSAANVSYLFRGGGGGGGGTDHGVWQYIIPWAIPFSLKCTNDTWLNKKQFNYKTQNTTHLKPCTAGYIFSTCPLLIFSWKGWVNYATSVTSEYSSIDLTALCAKDQVRLKWYLVLNKTNLRLSGSYM